MKNSNTNSDNQPNQTPNRSTRQAKKPDERTSDSVYQKLPLKFRPKAGRDQRDPMIYLHLTHRSEQDSRALVEKLCQELPR